LNQLLSQCTIEKLGKTKGLGVTSNLMVVDCTTARGHPTAEKHSIKTWVVAMSSCYRVGSWVGLQKATGILFSYIPDRLFDGKTPCDGYNEVPDLVLDSYLF
jgi:hypothetical protein